MVNKDSWHALFAVRTSDNSPHDGCTSFTINGHCKQWVGTSQESGVRGSEYGLYQDADSPLWGLACLVAQSNFVLLECYHVQSEQD